MKKLICLLIILLLVPAGFADDFLKTDDLSWTWYPQNKSELADMINGYLDKADTDKISGRVFAIISPHAAYQYSGPIAGYAFKSVQAQNVKTVIVLGFSHRKFFDGVSIYAKGAWRTPLGDAAIDEKLANEIMARSQRFKFEPYVFKSENSIEMQIPFIQTVFKDAQIVPIAFGIQSYGDAQELAKAFADVLKNRNDVLVVASTDMSHFHNYWTANKIDKRTIELLGKMDAKALYDEASTGAEGKSELCGLLPVATVMMAAQAMGYDKIKILKSANSGDVTGDKNRVVGYLSAAIYKEGKLEEARPVPEAVKNVVAEVKPEKKDMPEDNRKDESAMLTDTQRRKLLQIARESIANYVVFKKREKFSESDPVLNEPRGAFVTLHKHGELKGCIGNIIGRGPLYQTVADMAIEASVNDPRFSPLTAEEVSMVDIELSILTPLKKVKSPDEIRIPGHGVLVRKGSASGVFLPQVADETGWGRDEFLSMLCAHKAGLPSDAWKDPRTELYVFSADVFGEKDAKK